MLNNKKHIVMKTLNKYIIVALVALISTGCQEWLNAEPEGGTKTSQQKEENSSKTEAAAMADLTGMYAQFIQLFAGLGDDWERHNDFGYAATCMFTEANGMDFVGPNIGYNWFSFSDWKSVRDNTMSTSDGRTCNIVWNEYFKIIKAANNLISVVDPKAPGEARAYLSQALAVRAFCNMQLAQLYQFTYSDETLDLPCIPLVTGDMTEEQQLNNPRATVREVYDLIISDLNYACDSLEGYSRPDKGYVNQAVAYGLRARANMLIHKYKEAADDADMALTLSGATPLSIEEASVPGFTSAAAHNVLWANIIVETNDVVQTSIVNWPSHMSSFYTDGYTGVKATRAIASALYSQISKSDVRKGWWLNQSKSSPLLDADGYSAAKKFITDNFDPYTNVKFGTANGAISGLAAAAADWIMMRAEELILIKAEGLAKSGGDGAGVLTDFVKTYRDPEYTVSQHSLSLEDEIWWQRRVELWGEGFAWNDIMRLNKDVIRTNSSNWPDAWQQDVMAGNGILLWRIPQPEIEANQGISEADNNPFVAY